MSQNATPTLRKTTLRWIEDGRIESDASGLDPCRRLDQPGESGRLWRDDGEQAGTSELGGDIDGQTDQVSSPAAMSIHMSQNANDYGEIGLCVTLGKRKARISMPSAFDRFADLLYWLQAVRDGDLPIGVELDEESGGTSIIAYAIGDDRLVITVIDRWEDTECATAVVDAQNFLDTFRTELVRFLNAEMDVGNWLANPFDEPDDRYRTDLLAHPFLS